MIHFRRDTSLSESVNNDFVDCSFSGRATFNAVF